MGEKERRPGVETHGRELISSLTAAGPGTQAELARRLETSSATIRRTMEHLNKVNPGSEPAIFKAQAANAQLPPEGIPRGGEAAEVLMMGRAAGRVVGIEIGHGHLSVAVGDANGCLLGPSKTRVLWEEHQIEDVEPDETFDRLTEMVAAQLSATGTRPEEVRAVAASLPAPVGRDGRKLSDRILPSYSGVNVAEDLGDALRSGAGLSGQGDVFVENDVDVLARGEHRYGKAFGLRDFAIIKCSGGIGAAVLSNGMVVRGRKGGGVGEIGHCAIAPPMLIRGRSRASVLENRMRCRCRAFGHLESFAGGDALLARFADPGAGMKTREGGREWTLDELFRRARRGEEPFAQAIEEAGALVGIAAATIVNLFNPRLVLICGKFTEMGDSFMGPLIKECGSQGLLYGRADRKVEMGTATTAEERRRIGVRGAVTTALRKSANPLRIGTVAP